MRDAPRFDGALRALEDSTGLQYQREGSVIELAWRGHAHRFRAEARALLRPPHLPLLQEQLTGLSSAEPGLLVTHHVSAPLAEQLRERGVNFIDEAGNAYIETESWMVLVTGRAPSSQRAERSAVSRAMWQVAYVLLHTDTDALTVRELGARAGVSHGTAANALHIFERHGWLKQIGHTHPLTDAEGLLRGWEFGYHDRLRATLALGAAVAPGARSIQAWAEGLEPQFGPEWGLLGGELAAEKMGADIVATTATLHVPRWDAEIMKRFRVIPAREGPIEVLQTFGDASHDLETPSLADLLLVRAEILAIDDDRLNTARGEIKQRIMDRWTQ